jgi:hypothetical protein
MSSTSDSSALSNPSVSRCWEAGKAAYAASLAAGKDEQAAQKASNTAFRAALPLLRGTRNTRNFIACATFGMVMGVISGPESSRLLYAAQVAHTTRRIRKRETKSADFSVDRSHSGAIQAPVRALQEPSSEPAQAA